MARGQTESTRLAGPDCMEKPRMGRTEAKLPVGAGAGSPFANDYICTSPSLARSTVTCRGRRSCGCRGSVQSKTEQRTYRTSDTPDCTRPLPNASTEYISPPLLSLSLDARPLLPGTCNRSLLRSPSVWDKPSARSYPCHEPRSCAGIINRYFRFSVASVLPASFDSGII